MTSQYITAASNAVKGTFSALRSLTTIAKGVLCIPALLSQFKSVNLKAVMGNLGTFALSLANSLKETVQDQIDFIIAGALTSILNPIVGLLNTINDVLKQIKGLRDQIEQQAQGFVDYINNQQNCMAQGASLFNCLSQLAVNSINKKMVRDLSGNVDLITQKIQSATAGAQGAISGVVTREIQFANKLSQAIKLQ